MATNAGLAGVGPLVDAWANGGESVPDPWQAEPDPWATQASSWNGWWDSSWQGDSWSHWNHDHSSPVGEGDTNVAQEGVGHSGQDSAGDGHPAQTSSEQNVPWTSQPWNSSSQGWQSAQWRSSWDSWTQPRDWWHRAHGWQDSWRQGTDSQQYGTWSPSYKGDYSDPPAWPGWTHRKQWTAAVRRWNRTTDHPAHRRADKVLRALGWEPAAEFDHLSEQDLMQSDFLDKIFAVLDLKAGVRDGEERRAAFRKAIYHTTRRKDETLAQYAVRRQQEFTMARNHGIDVPKDFQALLLREGASLNEQNLQNLSALLQGQDTDPSAVARALGSLDVKGDRVTSYFQDSAEAAGDETYLAAGDSSDDDITTEDEAVLLQELDEMNISEDQATEVYLALDNVFRKRSWSESKKLKQEIRKDRGHLQKGLSGSESHRANPSVGRPHLARPRRRRLNREQLKKVTKCNLCQKKGHWAEDCPLNKQRQSGGQPPQAFTFAAAVSSQQHLASFLSLQEVRDVVNSVLKRSPSFASFLAIPQGEAILDIGAAQDLIGKKAFDELVVDLENKGLKPVILDEPVRHPMGIGGSASALFAALVPVSFGGQAGTLKMTVLEADIPPLLSIGFLEFLGAKIDLQKNTVFFERLGAELSMKRLPSGHRTVPLCDWPGGTFPVAPDAQQCHGVHPGDFDFNPHSVSLSYGKKKQLTCFEHAGKQGSQLSSSLAAHHLQLHQNCVYEPTLRNGNCHQEVKDDQQNLLCQIPRPRPCFPPSALSSLSCGEISCPEPIVNPSSSVSHGAEGDRLELGVLPSNSTMGATCPARSGYDGSGQVGVLQAHESREDQEEPVLQPHTPSSVRRQASCVPPSSQAADPKGKQVRFMDSMSSLSSKNLISFKGSDINQVNNNSDQCRCSTRDANSGHSVQPDVSACNLSRQGCVCSQGSLSETPVSDRTRERESFVGLPGKDVCGSNPAEYPDTALLGSPHRGIGTVAQHTDSHDAAPHSPGHSGTSRCEHGNRRGLGDTGRGRADPGRCSGVASPRHAESQPGGVLRRFLKIGLAMSSVPFSMFNSGMAQLTVTKKTSYLQSHSVNPHEGQCFSSVEMPYQQSSACSVSGATPPPFLPEGVAPIVFEEVSDRPYQPQTPLSPDVLWRVVRRSGTLGNNGILCSRPWSSSSTSTSWRLDHPEPVMTEYWVLPGYMLPHGFVAPGRVSPHYEIVNDEGIPSVDGEYMVYEMSPIVDHHEHLEDHVWLTTSKKMRQSARRLSKPTTTSTIAFAEVFSPPRVAPVVKQLGLPVHAQSSFDLTGGWDVRKGADKAAFLEFQNKFKPRMLMCSPECKGHSIMMNINWKRMDPKKIRKIRQDSRVMWKFSLEVAWRQITHGNFFAIEHPALASIWDDAETQTLADHPDVCIITFDMCELGLSVSPDGLSEKSTKVITNNPWLALRLVAYQCQRDHHHVHLEGNLPRLAQVYPELLCSEIAEATKEAWYGDPVPHLASWLSYSSTHAAHSTDSVFFGDDDDNEADEQNPLEQERQLRRHHIRDIPSLADSPGQPQERNSPQITDKQIRLVRRVHVNSGHPNNEQFLRMLRAAGCKEHILKYVRDKFSCDHCDIRRGPVPRRRAQMPKTFKFNEILSVDVLYLPFQGLSVPVLNMTCVGSGLQVATRIPIPTGMSGGTPTSDAAWKSFSTTWLRYFGSPTMIITDPGPEFKGKFERGCENFSIYQHLTHPESPWENAKAERHGGWLKQKLFNEINSGRGCLTCLEDFDECLAELCATKNRWLCRGGYTPYQLVFGEQPRLSHDLLSDDFADHMAMRDVMMDPSETDSASAEFRKKMEIRQQARQMAMTQASRDCVDRAVKSATHPVKKWTAGQWVYVFRRGRPGNELHPRDRWCGPGVVVLSSPSTTYVGMRSRLWRCSNDQLRPALPAEVLGMEIASDAGLQELLKQVTSGTHVGAVPVDREGPPPPDHHVHPVDVLPGPAEVYERSPVQDEYLEPGVSVLPHPVPVQPPPGLELDQPPLPIDLERQEHVPSTIPSRRHSVEEPVAEPAAQGSPLSQVPEQELGMGEIELDHPDQSGEAVEARGITRAREVRDEENDEPSEPPASRPSRLGDDQSVALRAPGTPVRQLLDRVIRTPVEELPLGDGRVRHQVQEIEESGQGVPEDRPLSVGSSAGIPVEISDEEAPTLLSLPTNQNPSTHEMEEVSYRTYESEEWSGSFLEFSHGAATYALEENEWVLLAKRNDEVGWKDLSEEEKPRFQESDHQEWSSILQTGAVKVHYGKDAHQLRLQYPERILSSRMVRRRKPQPGVPKSRWLVYPRAPGPRPGHTHNVLSYTPSRVDYALLPGWVECRSLFCVYGCKSSILPIPQVASQTRSVVCDPV